MSISRTDLKFYLTSVEPNIPQTIFSQSIGGYISTSLVYPETTLTSTAGLYSETLSLSSYSSLLDKTYVSVGAETMKVESISSNNINITQRSLNTSRYSHPSGFVIRGVSDGFFNDDLNDDLKQYRCVALKNTSTSDTAYNMKIYLKQDTVNSGSTIKLAVEVPKSDYLSSTSTSWSSMYLVDTSLGTTYDDNHFSDALLVFTSGPNSGQTRLISSYDKSENKFVFYNSLPFTSGNPAAVTYYVLPSPAQRIASGIYSPTFNSTRVSSLQSPTLSSPISIDVNSQRTDGNNLGHDDLIYIWIERAMTKGVEADPENTFVIGVLYKESASVTHE